MNALRRCFMTAALFNNSNVPFAQGVDAFVYPEFIGYAMRAPTTNDIYNPGTRWQDNSVNPPVQYSTVGSGIWNSTGPSGSFTSLTVNGTSVLTGGTLINSSGSANSTIGTGGTGQTFIGNATGNTALTGALTTSGAITATNGSLTLGTAGNKINVATGTNASAGTTTALTAGAFVVSTTAITANSLVFFSTHTLGTVTIPQAYRVSARTAGTSFTIQSSDATDTSTVDWFIIN